MSPDLIEKGNKFLVLEKPSHMILASQLKEMDTALFSSALFTKELLDRTSPEAWWKSLKSLEKVPVSAIDFICRLMKLPAGAADIERHFSTLGNIMSQRRARLGIEKASKLCQIYKALAGNCEANGNDILPD